MARRRASLPEHGLVIEAHDLEKRFSVLRKAGRVRRAREDVVAVAGVSFTISAGEMVGYIGPNGAGKSTTIKMLTGILVPTSGRATVAGIDPTRRRVEVARRIGVVFGQRTQLWWDLPLRDSFDLLRHVYRVDAEQHRRDRDELTELLDLAPLLDIPVRQLSLGQRVRGDLAAALLHDPEVLYLDEPTIGLDVVSKARVREFLAARNRERGTTVLLTTHDLDDIERLCSRVMIIDHGRLLYDGALSTVADRLGEDRVLVVDLAQSTPALQVPGARVLSVEGPRQRLAFRRSETTAAALISAVSAAADVVDLSIEEPDIEAVIRRVYAGDLTL
ncbi:MAG TPA: ATP-binding cassette domain-containing protein [Acidimicrobiales bacterium]|nr:ATP-binding cassette domain-containing protein [Acidimicrobiales bacterium]